MGMGGTQEIVQKVFESTFKLLEACLAVYDDPRYRQILDTDPTHCNEAVSRIADLAKNYKKFYGLNANQIISFLSKSDEWQEQSLVAEDLQELANEGRLLICGVTHEPHGHVCVIRPGLVKESSAWKMFVPSVVNIGPRNLTKIWMGLSIAFAPDNK